MMESFRNAPMYTYKNRISVDIAGDIVTELKRRNWSRRVSR